MSEKNIKTRVQNKHDIEANWLKAENFIPLIGEIIVYDADENNPLPRFKIGNGVDNVNTLTFTSEGIIYKHNEEPINAPEGSLWIDMDAQGNSGSSGGSSMPDASGAPEGAFLRVVNGVAVWSTIPNAEEATF